MSATPHPAHLDAAGNARMVDVAAKPVIARRAVAEAVVAMEPTAAHAVVDGRAPKGDVAAVARVSGLQAAKRTPDLIALCHPIALDRAVVDIAVDAEAGAVTVRAECWATARTGVEMEALTAASVAALNVWDMVKGIDPGVRVTSLRLVEKTKG